MQGKFFVLEGGEGTGKTTQAKVLASFLESRGREVLLTKEPGGDEGICKDIRGVLLNEKYLGKFSDRTELLLFEADRAQHVESIIKPALEKGMTVISDRFDAATFAYQCAARKVCTPEEFLQMNRFATGGLKPDFYFWIDIDPEIGLKRNVDAKKRDRFEKESLEFHQKVRAGYDKFFNELVSRNEWARLDGSKSIAEISDQLVFYFL